MVLTTTDTGIKVDIDGDLIVGKHAARRNKGLQESPIPSVYAQGVDLITSDEDCRNGSPSISTALQQHNPTE